MLSNSLRLGVIFCCDFWKLCNASFLELEQVNCKLPGWPLEHGHITYRAWSLCGSVVLRQVLFVYILMRWNCAFFWISILACQFATSNWFCSLCLRIKWNTCKKSINFTEYVKMFIMIWIMPINLCWFWQDIRWENFFFVRISEFIYIKIFHNILLLSCFTLSTRNHFVHMLL